MRYVDEKLSQAIAALREGSKREARELLAQVVAQDAENEQAWLWMSRTASTNRQRLMCLETMLDINPENEVAKPRRAPILELEQPAVRKEEEQPQVRLAAVIIVVCIVCLGGLALATASGILEQLPAIWVEATPMPRNTPVLPPTIRATQTPRPSPTPTVDTCTIDNPATEKYLEGSLQAIQEVGQAFECGLEKGAGGSAVTPCFEQLLETRSDFGGLWYPACAGEHRRRMLAFLDEAVGLMEAARDGNEEALDTHWENLEDRINAAQRESENLGELLKEASQ